MSRHPLIHGTAKAVPYTCRTNGRGAMAQLLVGSVAERVVRTAGCPVLTVKHPQHEFVVPDRAPTTTAQ
jgi:hypothetical protein